MRTILLTASGGPSTLSFSRSLRDVDPERRKYRLIGTDCDSYNIHRSEVDRAFLCPPATDPKYIPFLLYLIRREGVEFLHSQPEIEGFIVGKHREVLKEAGCRLFLPSQRTIELLRDKWESYRIWQAAGIKVPLNLPLKGPDDLKAAFARFGPGIWIRETIGAAGKGSLSRPSYEAALHHLNETKAWGHAVAAEHLTRRTVTWQSIWHQGKLVVAQARLRHNWAFGNRAQSGVTGLTGVGETLAEPDLDSLAIRCILAADEAPNGIFSVDFTYDKNSVPNPTEINIGKFFTTHHFVTRTGCNMPEILVQLAFDEYKGPYANYNPCEPDKLWIRGIDVEPVLISKAQFQAKIAEYEENLRHLSC